MSLTWLGEMSDETAFTGDVMTRGDAKMIMFGDHAIVTMTLGGAHDREGTTTADVGTDRVKHEMMIMDDAHRRKPMGDEKTGAAHAVKMQAAGRKRNGMVMKCVCMDLGIAIVKTPLCMEMPVSREVDIEQRMGVYMEGGIEVGKTAACMEDIGLEEMMAVHDTAGETVVYIVREGAESWLSVLVMLDLRAHVSRSEGA